MPLRPRRLLFPIKQIDIFTMRLRRELRKQYRLYRRNVAARPEAERQGLAAIHRARVNFELYYKNWLEKYNFVYGGDLQLIEIAEIEAYERWRIIVADFGGFQFSDRASVDIGAMNCLEYKVLKAKALQYWFTIQGITRRIDSLAQDTNMKMVNNAAKMVAPTNNIEWFKWITQGDANVCSECTRHSTGGRGGYYKVNWFMPDMPVHHGDRCQYELIYENPFPGEVS